MISRVSVLTAETETPSGQQGTEAHNDEQTFIVIQTRNRRKLVPKCRLTGGIVENPSFRTAASLVKCKHRHQVRVATLAVVGAFVCGGVAGFLIAITSLDESLIAVSMKHQVPRQCAVSF